MLEKQDPEATIYYVVLTAMLTSAFELNILAFYLVWTRYKLKKGFSHPGVMSVSECLCVSPILDSSASMILLTDSCISRTCRGAEGEDGGEGEEGWRRSAEQDRTVERFSDKTQS